MSKITYFLGILSSYTTILQSGSGKSSKEKRYEAVSVHSFILSSLESCKYYYKNLFSLLGTAVHQDTKASFFIIE